MKECLRLSADNFDREVLDCDIPFFVEFWASWCPPCKMMEPVIKDLAGELSGSVKVGTLNVDQNPNIRSRYDIASVPTFMVFIDGKSVISQIGAKSKKQLLEMIDQAKAEAVSTTPAVPIRDVAAVSAKQVETARRL